MKDGLDLGSMLDKGVFILHSCAFKCGSLQKYYASLTVTSLSSKI